ncbi:MAG: hypothetical protein RI960_1435 [Pseudomonadota bacterium]
MPHLGNFTYCRAHALWRKIRPAANALSIQFPASLVGIVVVEILVAPREGSLRRLQL